jgi:hypothetical protein
MPRINRDLQRRMAARRDRERRRPSGENRYRFGTSESAIEADEGVAAVDGAATTQPIDAPSSSSRQSRSSRGTTVDPKPAAASTRGGARPAALPFSAYTADYAYVIGDLRRVGLVIGSLLVILIVLYFVLPH